MTAIYVAQTIYVKMYLKIVYKKYLTAMRNVAALIIDKNFLFSILYE